MYAPYHHFDLSVPSGFRRNSSGILSSNLSTSYKLEHYETKRTSASTKTKLLTKPFEQKINKRQYNGTFQTGSQFPKLNVVGSIPISRSTFIEIRA